MEKLALLLFDMLLGTGYLIAGFILAILIQLIGYKVFHKNLYRWLCYNLIDKELKK